jgi:uncharacterized membrane protein (DUF373 family)
MADDVASTDLGASEPAGPATTGTDSRDHRSGPLSSLTGPAVRRWISVLEHSQDIVAVLVGIVLVLLAGVLLLSGIIDFVDGADGSISKAAPQLLDRVLLVLILVEIVHTVVLSLRAHRLIAQPFIVVGLIAVIRFILVVLTPGGQGASAAELGLLIGMVAVFVAGLIAVTIFEKGADGKQDSPPI